MRDTAAVWVPLRRCQAAIRQYDAYDENYRREVDRPEMRYPIVGERLPGPMHRQCERQPDDSGDNGGRPRPGESLAHPVPRQAGDGDPGRGDERRGGDMEVTDVVGDCRVEVRARHPV